MRAEFRLRSAARAIWWRHCGVSDEQGRHQHCPANERGCSIDRDTSLRLCRVMLASTATIADRKPRDDRAEASPDEEHEPDGKEKLTHVGSPEPAEEVE